MAATSYKDRISETSTFTGGGTVALLGAVNGFASFTRYNASQSGIPVLLEAIDASNQPTGEWEVSLCTLSADKRTLTRNTVRDSSNAGALVSFGAGTKRCTVVNDGMSIEGRALLVGGNAFTGNQTVAGTITATGAIKAGAEIISDAPTGGYYSMRTSGVEDACILADSGRCYMLADGNFYIGDYVTELPWLELGPAGADVTGAVRIHYDAATSIPLSVNATKELSIGGTYPDVPKRVNIRYNAQAGYGVSGVSIANTYNGGEVVLGVSAANGGLYFTNAAGTLAAPLMFNNWANPAGNTGLSTIDSNVAVNGKVTVNTPANLVGVNLLGSYSTTAGANPKLALYDSGAGTVFGLGVSDSQLDYMVPASQRHCFYVGGVLKTRIDQNGASVTGDLLVSGGINVTGGITAGGSLVATVSQLANYLPLTGGAVTGKTSFKEAHASNLGVVQIYGDVDPGTSPATLNIRVGGVGGGTAVPQYGIRVDGGASYNGASAMYGIWSRGKQNVGGPGYGVWGETDQANSVTECHGIHGRINYGSDHGNNLGYGGVAGVYGEAVQLFGTTNVNVSYAGMFQHKGTKGALNIGVYSSTVSGGTTVQPLICQHDSLNVFDIAAVSPTANGVMNLTVPGPSLAGLPPAICDMRANRGGVGGTTAPSYGLKVDSTSWNAATIAYGIWARGYQAVGFNSIGVYGETQQGASGATAHGIHGKTTYNSGLVNGGAVGVYGEAVLDPASTLNDQTSMAGMFEHKGTKGSVNIGVLASTVTGPTYPRPLQCRHDGLTIFEVTPDGVRIPHHDSTPAGTKGITITESGGNDGYALKMGYYNDGNWGAAINAWAYGAANGPLWINNGGGPVSMGGTLTVSGAVTAGGLVTGAGLKTTNGFIARADNENLIGSTGGTTYIYAMGGGTYVFGNSTWSVQTMVLNNAGNLSVTGTVSSGSGQLATVSQLASYLPLTGGTVTGNIITKGQINAQSTGAGQGYITMVPGNATNSGYIEFFNPAGTRTGYIGYTDATSLVITPEGGRSLKVASPIYADTTKRVYQQATAAAGGEIYISASAPSGGADGDIWLQYV